MPPYGAEIWEGIVPLRLETHVNLVDVIYPLTRSYQAFSPYYYTVNNPLKLLIQMEGGG